MENYTVEEYFFHESYGPRMARIVVENNAIIQIENPDEWEPLEDYSPDYEPYEPRLKVSDLVKTVLGIYDWVISRYEYGVEQIKANGDKVLEIEIIYNREWTLPHSVDTVKGLALS